MALERFWLDDEEAAQNFLISGWSRQHDLNGISRAIWCQNVNVRLERVASQLNPADARADAKFGLERGLMCWLLVSSSSAQPAPYLTLKQRNLLVLSTSVGAD